MKTPNLMENTIALSVTFRKPGNRRAMAKDCIDTEADKDMLHLSKDLLDSDELRAVGHVVGDTGMWLRRKCLPSLFRRGVYLLDIGKLDEVNAKLEQVETVDFPKAVNAFLAVYPERTAESRGRLKGEFDPAQYPDAEILKHAFGMSYQYISFDVPGRLKALNKKLYDEQRQKLAEKMEQGAVTIMWALRESMAGMVNYMVERLNSKTKDGKARGISKNSPMIDRMNEFLQDFATNYALVKGASNGEGEDPIDGMIAKAGKILKGVDVSRLRGDEELRGEVSRDFEKIKAVLDTLLINKPTRAISFEDE